MLRWDGYVMRRKKDDITKVIMLNNMEGIKRKRGRPKTRWMDYIEGDLKRLGVVN